MTKRVEVPVPVEVPHTEDFSEFFEQVFPRLARACVILTANVAEADDVAQEAMARVYERWDRVMHMASPAGYAFRTAVNVEKKRRRRRAIARKHATTIKEEDESVFRTAELRVELEQALRQLPFGQRAALLLVDWAGYSSEEAAALLNIRPASVRGRVSRARPSMKTYLTRGDST